jgi:hypothetical protein
MASQEPAAAPPEPVVVHTSFRGLGGAVVTPLVLMTVGVAVIVVGGLQPVAVGLALLGATLALVTLLDYPRHAVFDHRGVTRACVARRHHLPWTRIVAIERTRPTTTASVRNLVDKDGQAQVSGGLVARGSGRKRWLLTDRIESNLEYDRLRSLLERLDIPTQLRAARPHDGITPTDLYRPRRRR